MEGVLRAHMPLRDGFRGRVNDRVMLHRDSHEYMGSPSDEEQLNYLGRIDIDGESYRFAWFVTYRDGKSERATLRVARENGGEWPCLPWPRRMGR
jgi:hypothetical protein